jgi:hypothetical protein
MTLKIHEMDKHKLVPMSKELGWRHIGYSQGTERRHLSAWGLRMADLGVSHHRR